jgi:hypothetical protein
MINIKNKEILNNHPPFKKVISYCTTGNLQRDGLTSDWYTVTMEDNS